MRRRANAVTATWLLLGWMSITVPAWAGIGWVERMHGTVNVDLPQGGSRALAVGDPVEENQTVRTGPDGEAVVHFVDNAVMIVRPGSKVRVAAYRYTENDASSVSLLRLVKGSLRFASGLVGKLNRDNVKIESAAATIGIRGTDFDTVFLEERAGELDAGSYTCVSEGGAYMRDSSGKEVEIAEGQTGFMTSVDFIAKGLAAAARIGVIQPPPGLFRSGTFDGEMQNLKQEGLRRLQNRVNQNVPAELRGIVPGADALVSGATELLSGMFGKKEKKQGGSPCAS